MKRFVWGLIVCVALLMPSMALAAGDGIDVVFSLNRDYIPAPPGTLAVLTYYENITSDSHYTGYQKDSTANLSANVGLFRPVYWVEWGPLIIDPQFIIPFGAVSDHDTGLNDRNGIGDPIFFATFWFVHDKDRMLWIGNTPFLTVPGGEYNRTEPLSHVLSGNRYKFQDELGIVKGFCIMPGHNAYLEAKAGGVWQTDNDNATNKPCTRVCAIQSRRTLFLSWKAT